MVLSVSADGFPDHPDPRQHRVYTLADFDPDRDGTFESWRDRLAADGWAPFVPGGAWVQIERRRVWRWSLYRDVPLRQPSRMDVPR
jgi:hypothetical protein